MKCYIETINGRYAGTTIAINNGEICNIGSNPGSDLYFPNDSALSSIHFAVVNKNHAVELKTFNHSIYVNNRITGDTGLVHGDFIFGGETLFYLCLENKKTLTDTPLGNLISYLSGIENLYLLIDEAADKNILPLVEESKSQYIVLKDEVKNIEALTSNPLLVNLNKEFIEAFVREFWGQGRLVFLEPKYSFNECLVFFKLLLSNTLIDSNIDFRFYDPRMLRFTLGEIDKKFLQYFFAGAVRYFVESQLPGYVFEFSRLNNEVKLNQIRLSFELRKVSTRAEISNFLQSNGLIGDIRTISRAYLEHFSGDWIINFKPLIESWLLSSEKYGLISIVSIIQFMTLCFLLGEEPELNKLFEKSNISNDEKLAIYVRNLNLKRR